MSNETITIDAGTLEFSEEDLSATGLLTPYGVTARSNLGEFTVEPGVFTFSEDVTGNALNIEHRREDVVGALTKVWEQETGLFASFKFANTDEGREAFAAAKSGKRKNLSAEVAKVRIKDGKAISGRVFGAALVERPAFEGATLLAAEDTPDPTTEPDAYAAFLEKVHADIAAALEAVAAELSKAPAEDTTPPAAPAEETKSDDYEEFSMSDNTAAGAVPATLLANAPAAKNTEVEPSTVFAAMHTVKNGIQGQTADAETLLAALSDITVNTTGGLTTSASGVIQPAWVGKLWQGKRYERKYIDLGNHLYGGIQLGGRKGFTLDQGTALVQHWNGNKTELPTGKGSTSTRASSLQKYGYAADVAREWFDLEGGAEVIQAFFEGVVDSYAEITDQDALAALMAAALPNLEAPGTYPAEYPATMGMLIDAIEAVQDANDDATFALVNPVAWRQLIQTPKDLVPEFVSFNFQTGGNGSADGKVQVRKAPAEAFTGLDATAPAIVAGAKNAIEFREQGQTPIQVDALDIARGGIDRAILGYLETFLVRPESFVAFGTAGA